VAVAEAIDADVVEVRIRTVRNATPSVRARLKMTPLNLTIPGEVGKGGLCGRSRLGGWKLPTKRCVGQGCHNRLQAAVAAECMPACRLKGHELGGRMPPLCIAILDGGRETQAERPAEVRSMTRPGENGPWSGIAEYGGR